MSYPCDDGIRRALDAAGVALATFDGEGHALSANTAFVDLMGSDLSSVIGCHLVGLCNSNDSATVTSTLVRMLGGVSESESLVVSPKALSQNAQVRLSLTVSPHRRDDDRIIFCVASYQGVDPATRPQAPLGGTARAQDHLYAFETSGLEDLVRNAATTSARTGHPFAVLRCGFGISTGSGPVDTEALDDEMLRIAISRIGQRLRSTDSVVFDDEGRIHVIAEALGDSQDAAGVAYRLLSTMVEPFSVGGKRRFVHMTVGIAVADDRTDPGAAISASSEALHRALNVGVGSFKLIELRGEAP